ncbi:MAG: hypothetical protein K2X93_02930 [Candidatus Obscuribacterales bacterium]|nr:hypothetical protein [Candidatus Obscuribacterales bacterium]
MAYHEVDQSTALPSTKQQPSLSARVFDMMVQNAGTKTADKATSIAMVNLEPAEKTENKWEKNKPDVVKEEAESPSKSDVSEATKKADELFEDELTKKVYKALISGHAGGLDILLHDLRHDQGLEKGEGKKLLQKVVDNLNKVLRYPVELVTNNESSPPPELGLKFKAYHYDAGGQGDVGSCYSEETSVTMWGFGKYEAKTFYKMPRSAANLGADMGEADKRLKTMLVQSALRSKQN